MITIRNLTRRYGDTIAVDAVDTTIDRGEIVGLLGHNGAGKTTVMKMLTGYLDPSEGSVAVDGIDVQDDRAAAQHRIGYLPENAPLYDEMIVQDYLRTVAALRGVPAGQIDARVGEAIVATDLEDRRTQRIGTLSKGLRQRVGIAQAILHQPDVLVLDEPTNGLDPTQIQHIRALVRRLGERSTILLSTHILQEVEAVCDRVIILIRGRVVADAPLSELTGTRKVRVWTAVGTDGVAEALRSLGPITDVEALPPHQGMDRWDATFSGDTPPVSAILDLAQERGWVLGGVAPEQRTLETVFQELQAQHAEEVA